MSTLTLSPEELQILIQPSTGTARPDPIFLSHAYDVSRRKPFQWTAKRAIDIAGSLMGIVVLAPLFLLIALAIKLDSPGPVLYRQMRMGRHGETFLMYKFRSMHQNAEANLDALLQYNETNDGMFKMYDDPRVTRVGRFIRKYSLDEFPQLLNVLRGEMSLVGPRPPILREVRQYKNWHYLRFATLPGLTGLWQVSGRSRVQDFDSVVKMDYHYINEWNVGLDCLLILKTFPVVLLGKDTA